MNFEITEAVQLALIAYRLAWKYRWSILKQWAPRAEELRKLDEFDRTHIAWENADYRSESLIEEAGHVLLRAVSEREPIPPDRFKHATFERCRNRLWLKALDAYKTAFNATHEAAKH